MVEELKRNITSENKEESNHNPIESSNKENVAESDISCEDIDSRCVLSHICYKYSAMVMAGLIEALDYFAGNQGPKVLLRILAKNIPQEMMKALEIDINQLKDINEEQMIAMLPELMRKKGGPEIKIEKLEDGSYRFLLNECHFLPYSKTKGFCNVTAGLMLGFAQMLSKKSMDIKEIQTIAHGGSVCEFIASPKKL